MLKYVHNNGDFMTIRRKHILLDNNLLLDVKRYLHAKTDTEAILLSLKSIRRKKKLEKIINMKGKCKFELIDDVLNNMG